MKRFTKILWPLVLGAAGLLGQTRAKSQPAQKPQPPAASDHEKNIRAYIELLRSDARKNKAQVVGVVMQLDAGEAAKFWPIYREFESEYTAFGDGVVALIKDYATNYDNMTPQAADQMAARLLDLEQQRIDLKRKFYQKFKDALDPATAARFLQVESQLERIMDLQIESDLPVIGGVSRSNL